MIPSNNISRLVIKPLGLKKANAFVLQFHRHHKSAQGHKFSIGLFENDELCGVAICGRPVSRNQDDGLTAEVIRMCVSPNVRNGCSKLYAACATIAKGMGYCRIITYTLETESGASLRASGWTLEAENLAAKTWDTKSRRRVIEVSDLFGTATKYPTAPKKRWVKIFRHQ